MKHPAMNGPTEWVHSQFPAVTAVVDGRALTLWRRAVHRAAACPRAAADELAAMGHLLGNGVDAGTIGPGDALPRALALLGEGGVAARETAHDTLGKV
ncbi:MAG: hypothetical protein AB7L71_02485 [Vicinamibacterales bacterium]